MNAVRQPAVAGQFYPGSADTLITAVDGYLAEAEKANVRVPKAIIAPHAGFNYSGPVAAKAYVRLQPAKKTIKRVILLGPCHRVAVQGLALSSADAFATPLGEVPIDSFLRDIVIKFPQVKIFDATHKMEHSLEVHLPFLQRALDDFTLLPVVVGQASPSSIAEVLHQIWGGDETLIVVSSDLSHFLDYDSAREIDTKTSGAIQNLIPNQITGEAACGRFPLGGLLVAAKARQMTVENVDLRNSGDTAGSRDKVVGYGSWLFFEREPTTSQKNTAHNVLAKSNLGQDVPDPINEITFEKNTKLLLDNHGLNLIDAAIKSIDHGLKFGRPLPVNLAEHPKDLHEKGSCFITLTHEGKLRGCIGSPEPYRPLIEDIKLNAFSAAFKDPRFPKLTLGERNSLALSISIAVLSLQTEIKVNSENELIESLRPQIDGLVISDGPHRALFLPSVWEQLPNSNNFLRRLKQKAGLAADHWSVNFKAWRFITAKISISEFPINN